MWYTLAEMFTPIGTFGLVGIIALLKGRRNVASTLDRRGITFCQRVTNTGNMAQPTKSTSVRMVRADWSNTHLH